MAEPVADGADASPTGGEMAAEPAAGAAMEVAGAAAEEMPPAPAPEIVEEAMEVAAAPAAETASPEALRIEADGEPGAIVLEPPAEPEMAEPEPEPEMEMEMAESAAPAAGPRVQLAAFRSPERAEIGWGADRRGARGPPGRARSYGGARRSRRRERDIPPPAGRADGRRQDGEGAVRQVARARAGLPGRCPVAAGIKLKSGPPDGGGAAGGYGSVTRCARFP